MPSPDDRPAPASEAEAREYLLSLCWPGGRLYCQRCKGEPVYRLKTGRLRCKKCGYTFQDFTGRRLSDVYLSCLDWLALVASFTRETQPTEAASELGISYNSARKAYHAMRLALAASALDAPQLAALLSGESQDAAADRTVLGIIEKNGFVFVDVLPEMDADTLLIFKHNFRLRTASIGGVIYTDRYRHYDTLLASVSGVSDSGGPHRDKNLFVEEGHGFWSFVVPRLKSRRGLGPGNLLLYFKEFEFRYNHRGQNLPRLIANLMCAQVAT